MKFHLSHSTAGRFGGLRFKGILKHFDRYIQQKIEEQNFESSFEEFWLTFAYPPLFMLPGVVSMRERFLKTYSTFPVSRVLRRYNKIEVTIQLPEFSEHFDLKEQKKYKNKYSVEEKYQNLTELQLANILIDKYVEAIELIEPKLKKTDTFDSTRLKEIIASIKSDLSVDLLKKISSEESEKLHDEVLKRAIELRKERKENFKPANKGIRDFRVYPVNLPKKALYPYDYQYSEIFINLLSKNQLKCPDYHHLYIKVANTREEALKSCAVIVDWFVEGIATINYKGYERKNENEKSEIVFNLLCEGLLDIAEIDHLDKTIIQKTIDEIKIKGLDTELTCKVKEHKKYTLKITYLARSMEEECPIYFTIEVKETGKKYRVKIGKARTSQIWLWLQKISLTQKKIKIKSSDSIRAKVWLKNKERKMEFDLADIMKKENEYVS